MRKKMPESIVSDFCDMKIAVVDDDPDTIDLLQKRLTEAGYKNLIFANSANAGWSLIREQCPDIVVLDVVMPGMNGYELCAELRRDSRFFDLPVIMVTGSDPEADEPLKAAFAAGATDFIRKPVNTTEFLARVKSALELKRANGRFKKEIDRRKRAEKEIASFRNYLKSIIDSMPSIVVGIDPENRVTLWNSAAERISGRKAEDAVGSILTDIFPQFTKEIGEAGQVISKGVPRTYEKEFVQKNGQIKHVDVMIYPLLEAGQQRFAVIRIDDVTEKVKAIRKLSQGEKMSSLGWMAVGMAHEVSNPLAGILQNIQLIRKRIFSGMLKNRQVAEEVGTSIEAIRAYLEKRDLTERFDEIKALGLRSSKLVNNILSLSRTGGFVLERCSVKGLLECALERVMTSPDLKLLGVLQPIKIIRDYKTVPDVFCDRDKLEQVFFHILKNSVYAMRSMHDGGEAPQITLCIKEDPEMAVVEIVDNGIGMVPETKERVFEPFFTTWRSGDGMGLGLSLAYFIITEKHKGSIAVDSFPDQGSRLTVKLPKADSAAAEKIRRTFGNR